MYPQDSITKHFHLSDYQKKALKKLRLETIQDLLYHFPTRYDTLGEKTTRIADVSVGDKVVLFGTLSKLKAKKAWRKKIPMAEGRLSDDSGHVDVVWFNQPYLAKMIPENAPVKVAGKVSERAGKLYLSNPEVEQISSLPIGADNALFKDGTTPALFPIYPESRGVTSRWMYYTIQKIFNTKLLNTLEDPLPEHIRKSYHLPDLKSALIWIHTPKNTRHSQAARKRFAFEEVFLIQLKKYQDRARYDQEPSWIIQPEQENMNAFTGRFPFKPTNAQNRAVKEILRDIGTPSAMSRLLEGDVGSGKTYVAATTTYATVTTHPPAGAGRDRQDFGNLQVAYMAPTEILAKQHFESFIEYFSPRLGGENIPPIQIGLITGSGCRKFPSKVNTETWTDISRPQLLKWVKNGEIPILIGTHALIQKTVAFKHLAYVIIDEQHRFGVAQRKALASGKAPNKRGSTLKQEKLLYEELTYKIRQAIFEVKKTLGSGHKETVYQKALEAEFKKLNIPFEREKNISVLYKGKKVGSYQPDFVIDNKVLLELKALPRLSETNKKQVWNYLKGTSYKLALLVNFGSQETEIARFIYDTAQKNIRRSSASVPHESTQEVRLPHLLSMTATPIPRTLALTIYGDLDLTLLDEMPAGRKTVETKIVPKDERNSIYERVREELAAGRQAYVITPRIEEPDPTKQNALRVKSVKEEAKRLKKNIFPEYAVGILHGKLTPKEKDVVMNDFAEGRINILVATSVVEVGVNVPNATTIIIEGPERFGLAQLHQLRGRVLRSTHQAYCYLFPDTKSKTSLTRLRALEKTSDGFKLAETDLNLRGSGELAGGKQWGISDIGMEAIKNPAMVEAARKEARVLIEKNFELSDYPLLAEKVRERGELHFE